VVEALDEEFEPARYFGAGGWVLRVPSEFDWSARDWWDVDVEALGIETLDRKG
jgi:hypothetical protein